MLQCGPNGGCQSCPPTNAAGPWQFGVQWWGLVLYGTVCFSIFIAAILPGASLVHKRHILPCCLASVAIHVTDCLPN